MDSMAIMEDQKIVETTVRFCISKIHSNYGQTGYNPRAKFQEKIETMERLALIQEQQIVETTPTFSI